MSLEGLSGQRDVCHQAPHAPAALWGDARRCSLALWSSREEALAAGGWGYRSPEEVCKAGTGMAVRHVVTRGHSAWTGPEGGRCQRIRSLSCVTGVATLTSVRMTVEGGAVARAV